MRMHKVTYETFYSDLYTEVLDNGLTVYLLPKVGFQQVFATFTTKYGSVDNTFSVNGHEMRTVPDGIAHFLEHKMFEEEEGDVFAQFAEYGASANAFTSFDQTTYLFSATEHIEKNVTTLLDFVQHPYFTEENVEKEKGIIGQEIRMYDDNPDWRGFFDLLRALYQNHPLRIDIAGTVESIGNIDKDTLYHCYSTFYHPSNMIFVAVGGFDPVTLMDYIRENQAHKKFAPKPHISRQYPEEPSTVANAQTVAHLSVAQPRCLVGWKDATWGLTGKALLTQEMLTGVLMDTLFGKSSVLYDALIEEQLIDQQFSWEYDISPLYGYGLVGGNTPDPQRLQKRIEETLENVQIHGLNTDDFERSRKKSLGRFMASLDQSSYIARSFTSYILKEANLFETVDILEQLTIEDANHRFQELFQPTQKAVSIVLPKNAS